MTREQIETMEAGREMDALVAEKVMGWRPSRHGEPSGWWTMPGHSSHAPKFSSDIAASWQIVEKFRDRGWDVDVNCYCSLDSKRRWRVSIDDPDEMDAVEGGGDSYLGCHAQSLSAPLAICRAALLATLNPQPVA